jgi:hypothetical protein
VRPGRAAAALSLGLAGLAIAACGKYGPPVRSRSEAEVAAPAETPPGTAPAAVVAPEVPANAERSEPEIPRIERTPSEETEP